MSGRRTVSTAGRKTSRPRGYIENYNPQAKTVELVNDAISVLDDYEDYLPLTVRQIFYRLVGSRGYPKTEKFYSRLAHHLANARRGRLISFDSIRDDNVSVMRDTWYRDSDHFMSNVRRWAEEYKRDLLYQQDYYLEVWCESAGMVPQLARIANAYSIKAYSTSGFDSLTAKKDIADRVVEIGKPAVILHCGDYDPSGEAIYTSAAEDVAAFVKAHRRLATVKVEYQRVALTRDQVEEYELPTAPAKGTDSRSKSWEGETCQLEALRPDHLQDLVNQAIRGLLDEGRLTADLMREEAERMLLTRALPAASNV